MKKSSIIKSTVIVMIVTVVSRVIGFLRDILIASHFGASSLTDAYKIAASIPDTIFMLVGLAISTTFVPMLSSVKAKKGNEEMHKFANNIINILLCISVVIFAVSSFFPEQIVNLLAHNFDAERMRIASELTRITLFNLLFLAVNACFTALLQVHEDFIVPSMLGLFFNLPMIIYLLLFKDFNIYGLTVANVIGNFARVAVQVPSLHKHGYRYKCFINFKDSRVKKILILILPVLIGSGANSLNMVVDNRISSGLGEGAVTTLGNAQILITFVNTIITTSISSVVYPLMSNRRSEGKHDEFLELLSKSIVFLAILLIPITVGMVVYAKDIIKIVYMRGQFGESAVSLATFALLGYSVGLFFIGVRDILNSTLFSMGETKVTAYNGVVGVVFNVILSVTLSKLLGIAGVTLASSIAMIVTSMLLLRSIVKLEGKLDISSLFKKILKITSASFFMALAIIFVNKFTYGMNSIIHVLSGTIIGIIVYFISVYLLKLTEINEIIGMLKNKANS